MIYLGRKISDEQITYIVEFTEQVDIKRLEDSLAALKSALPILSSRLVIKKHRLHRVDVATAGRSIELIKTDRDPREAILEFVVEPSDPLTETPLKICLIRNEDKDTLCIKVDHVLTDAAGLKHLLYLLAEAYTTEKISLSLNNRRGWGPILRRISPFKLMRALVTTRFPMPGSPLLDGRTEAAPPFIERADISPDHFSLMRRKAAQNGATINDVLLTALYRVVFENEHVEDGIAYPVMVTVDLRRYLPEQRRCTVANHSIGIYPCLAKVPQETFEATLRRVKKNMDELKQRSPGIGSMILISLACIGGGRILEDKYGEESSNALILTNFGAIDQNMVQFGQPLIHHVYAVGPHQHAPGILITVTSYRDTLTLVVQGTDRRFQSFIRDFLQSIVSEVELYARTAPQSDKCH